MNPVIPARANFTSSDIAAACRNYGPGVGPLPAGVDGAQLLWAIAGVESSFGLNCQPRHEPAYDVGGHYATHAPMPGLLQAWGPAAACSYGPWQLMLCDAPVGMTPQGFDSLDGCAKASLADLNRKLRNFKPQNLAEIGECWNAGHITPDSAYTNKLARSYALPIGVTK